MDAGDKCSRIQGAEGASALPAFHLSHMASLTKGACQPPTWCLLPLVLLYFCSPGNIFQALLPSPWADWAYRKSGAKDWGQDKQVDWGISPPSPPSVVSLTVATFPLGWQLLWDRTTVSSCGTTVHLLPVSLAGGRGSLWMPISGFPRDSITCVIESQYNILQF